MNSLKQRSNLKQGYLIRYADDWVILTSSEDEAIRWKKSCTKYLKDKLKIELSEDGFDLDASGFGLGAGIEYKF